MVCKHFLPLCSFYFHSLSRSAKKVEASKFWRNSNYLLVVFWIMLLVPYSKLLYLTYDHKCFLIYFIVFNFNNLFLYSHDLFWVNYCIRYEMLMRDLDSFSDPVSIRLFQYLFAAISFLSLALLLNIFWKSVIHHMEGWGFVKFCLNIAVLEVGK